MSYTRPDDLAPSAVGTHVLMAAPDPSVCRGQCLWGSDREPVTAAARGLGAGRGLLFPDKLWRWGRAWRGGQEECHLRSH